MLDKPYVPIKDADADGFFVSGLEYNPPARGVWNIVHTGMLIPCSHQVFVCAQGCLRGVVLTAAEMGALHRMSTVTVTEQDMFDGSLESDVIDGTIEIIEKLPYKPKVLLLYLSCIHLFAGCDIDMIISELNSRLDGITTVDCYMTPTMRKTITPDAKMRMQLYAALPDMPADSRSVNIIGNDRPTDSESELIKMLTDGGYTVRDLTQCRTYEEYTLLASSVLNITYLPSAYAAGESLNGTHLHLPNSFDGKVLRGNYTRLCTALDMPVPELDALEAASEKALHRLADTVGNREIAIDFTAVTRPFELALVLLRHGMNVRYIVADQAGEDKDAFFELKKEYPDIILYSAVNTGMIDLNSTHSGDVLAIGQKAAFYFGTDSFVNTVANGGMYGFDGIVKLCSLTEDAHLHKKDRRTVIQHKGFGCECCIC